MAFEEVFLFALLNNYRRLQCPAAAGLAPVLNVSLYDYRVNHGSYVSVLCPQHLYVMKGTRTHSVGDALR